jgi:hypothetical protein
VIAGVEVQRSTASWPFGALARGAFTFVRHQAQTVGMLAWLIRNQMRRPKNRDRHTGWDHD